MAEVMAQQQGSEYTFSSAAFRKKKKKKKIRNKKIITTEEAVSRRCRPNQEITRSQSTPALVRTPRDHDAPKMNQKWDTATPQIKANSALVTPPPPPPPPSSSYQTPALSATPPSPIQKETSKTKSRGQQELEAELELSSHNRELRKPWETDIRKKKKTEYGDILLRNGPCSADRIQSSSAASHHLKFRRARSLSTTRHRSVSRHRSRSRSQRSSLKLFSDWYSSESEDEANDDETRESQLEQRSSFDDEDITYEKYRQFLASNKSDDEDETLSRQSVLSLKQKVGAAPSLEFSYRYSAAADELLNGDNNNLDDSCGTNQLESKCNTEETTNLTEPEDLSVRLQQEVETESEPHEFLRDTTNDESDGSKTRDTQQTIFVGDVAFDEDERSDSENGEIPLNHQESASLVEQEEKITHLSSPPSSPVSSSHPPYLTDSSSPIKYPPTPTSTTTEELSLPPFPQPPLGDENDSCEEMSSLPTKSRQEEALRRRLEEERLRVEEELRFLMEEEERIRKEEEERLRLQEELRVKREEEERIRKEEEEQLRLQEELRVKREEEERIRKEEEERLRLQEELRVKREEEERIREEEEHRLRKVEELRLLRELAEKKKREIEERKKEQNRLRVLEEQRRREEEEERQRQKELRRQRMVLEEQKKRKIEEERRRKIQEEEKRLQKEREKQQQTIEEEKKTKREVALRQRREMEELAMGKNAEKVDPIQDFETLYLQDENDINEEGDDDAVEEMEEDPEYPEEDRVMLNMLYSIHMG